MVGKGNSQHPAALPIANLFPVLDQLHLQLKPANQLSLIRKELLCLYSKDEQFLSVATCLILLQILDVALGEVLLIPWVEPAMRHQVFSFFGGEHVSTSVS